MFVSGGDKEEDGNGRELDGSGPLPPRGFSLTNAMSRETPFGPVILGLKSSTMDFARDHCRNLVEEFGRVPHLSPLWTTHGVGEGPALCPPGFLGEQSPSLCLGAVGARTRLVGLQASVPADNPARSEV